MDGSWIALGLAALALYSLIGGVTAVVLLAAIEWQPEFQFLAFVGGVFWPVTAVFAVLARAVWILLVVPARLGCRATEYIIFGEIEPPPRPGRPVPPEPESHKPETF